MLPKLTVERKLIVYISKKQDLDLFLTRAKTHSVIAVDTEFLREKTYYPQLCLIQIGTADEQVAIDPLLLEDLSGLTELFVDPAITKVFHAASQDIEIIQQEFGVVPKPLFDTQIAAAFLGHPYQMGYSTLVELYEGVSLKKAESLTDWSRRPLDAAQLDYAFDDVRYLPSIFTAMHQELSELKRLVWVEAEFNKLIAAYESPIGSSEAYKRVKRISTLSHRQLAVAREVAKWREDLAQKRNMPRKWLLADELVIELAKRVPQDIPALNRMRNTDSISIQDKQSLIDAIARGKYAPKSSWPTKEKRARSSRELEGVADLANALIRVVAEKERLAPVIIASRDDLMTFLSPERNHSVLSQGWRYELVGELLEKLLDGAIGLTVHENRVEILTPPIFSDKNSGAWVQTSKKEDE